MFRQQHSKMQNSSLKNDITPSSLKNTNLISTKKDTLFTIPTYSGQYLSKMDLNTKNEKKRLNHNNIKVIKTPVIAIEDQKRDKNKHFSLLDINDKITNSKGPNMPWSYLKSNLEYYSKLQERSLSYNTIRQMQSNAKETKGIGIDNTIDNDNKNKDNDKSKNESQKAIQAFTESNNQSNNKPSIGKVKAISTEDIFANPNIKYKHKYKNISLNLIRAKNIASDVFYTKCTQEADEYKVKAKQYPDFQKSNVFAFNIDNDPLYNYKDNYYNSTRESKSEWHTKNSIPTLLNYSSIEFDIITNRIPSISKSKIAITTECNKQGIKLNPIKRQKSLCEYIDLTRTSHPNPNKDYFEYYNNNYQPFNRPKNICSEYYDIHKKYNALCDLPFVKKKYFE